jgi:hypothetical protein
MRQMIYLLIAINCAYFGWQTLHDGPDVEAIAAPSPIPGKLKPLVTLRERAAQRASEARHVEEVTQTQPPAAVNPPTCRALGPFLAESYLAAIEQRLNRRGLTVKPQVRGVEERVGYAVLLPDMTYDDALQARRRLTQENMAANFIGTGNVLSLGTFREKSQAKHLLASAREIGFEPHLEPSYANRSTYWLVFQEKDDRQANVAEFTRKNSRLRLEETACP